MPQNARMRLLALAAATLALAADCGGGGGGGGPGGVTITGTVAGTIAIAYDLNGNEVGRATASGTPPAKSFSLALPQGGTYLLFLVENEGTGSQRIYPLYADASLATNVFSLREPGTVDLGFVDTTSGNALPAKNPLFANGVSSAGQSSTIPVALTTVGTVFSQVDLAGSWALNGIVATTTSVDWIRALVRIDTSGNSSFDELEASFPIGYVESFPMLLSPGGVAWVTEPTLRTFQGFVSGSKDLMVWVMSIGTAGQALGVMQKLGGEGGSLPGTYRFHQLKGPSVLEPSQARSSWARGQLVVDESLAASVPGASFETSDPGHNTAASYSARLGFGADGAVTTSDNPTFRGTLSQGGSTLIATVTTFAAGPGDLEEHVLLIAQRADAGFEASELPGTWSLREMEVWPRTRVGWSYGKAAIDAGADGLRAVLLEVAPEPGPEDPFSVSLSAEGLVTVNGNGSLLGTLSADRKLLVATSSADDGQTSQLIVLQR